MLVRQKKEADDKAKADKVEEKRVAREKADLEREKSKEAKETSTNDDKGPNEAEGANEAPEDAEATAQATPKIDILRRADSTQNDMVADEEDEEGEERVQPTDDKAVKPKVIVRTPTGGKPNGSWRNGPAKKPATETTATELEDDGWSTVSKPKKQGGNRRNNGPARAAAS